MMNRKPLLSAALMFALRLLTVECVTYAATAPPAASAVDSVATPMPALGAESLVLSIEDQVSVRLFPPCAGRAQ